MTSTIIPDTKRKTFLLRIKFKDYARIVEKAYEYADGNVSEWFRYAAMNHIPSEEDLYRKVDNEYIS